MRLFLTLLGTFWVASVIVGYVAFGMTLYGDGQVSWWFFGWVLPAVLVVTPFILYATIED